MNHILIQYIVVAAKVVVSLCVCGFCCVLCGVAVFVVVSRVVLVLVVVVSVVLALVVCGACPTCGLERGTPQRCAVCLVLA